MENTCPRCCWIWITGRWCRFESGFGRGKMRMKAGLVAGVLALLPDLVSAEGCALSSGVVLPKLEALNQLMLDLEVTRFAAGLGSRQNLAAQSLTR
jgi:hypothetical protein